MSVANCLRATLATEIGRREQGVLIMQWRIVALSHDSHPPRFLG